MLYVVALFVLAFVVGELVLDLMELLATEAKRVANELPEHPQCRADGYYHPTHE